METKTQAQLDLIQEMVNQSRNRISEGSIFYLLWGWLVVIAAAINYYLLVFLEHQYHWLAWPVLMSLGGILSGIIGYKQERESKVKTYIDRAINNLWIAFTISLILMLVAMVQYGPQPIYPMIIILYGLGTFVSGGILKFKPLVYGGILCWLIGSVAVYANFSEQLLLLIAAVIGSYIIPGYLLRKSDQHV